MQPEISMGYAFTCPLLRSVNQQHDYLSQWQAIGDRFGRGLNSVIEHQPFATSFFGDLNGFLLEVEKGSAGSDFKPFAAICVAMALDVDFDVLNRVYLLDTTLVGTFLSICMRVVNRSRHDTDMLKRFKHRYDALGITISGDWDKCLERAGFSWTLFQGTTLEVEAIEEN